MPVNDYIPLLDTPEARKLLGMEWGPLPRPSALPPFPVEALTNPCRQMIEGVSQTLQSDPGMAACFLLVVASTAMIGKVSARVYGDYCEPVQLMIAVSANPSERKSAVLSYMETPLREYIREENTRRKPEITRQSAKMELLKRQRDEALRKGHEGDLVCLTDEITAAEENAMRYIELITTDATPEGIGAFMDRNGGCASILSGEGGIINILAGAYSENVILDPILKGYSGEPIAVERIGRAPVRIDKAALSIGIAVQPHLLSQFLSNEVLQGRGLHARFLYALPESMVGRRVVRNAVPLDVNAKLAYAYRIKELARMQTEKGTHELSLAPEALDAYFTFAQEIENMSGPGGQLDGVASGWGGKLAGNTVRISAILKMLDNPDTSKQINLLHFQSAIQIARYFMAHVLAVTGRNTGLSCEAMEALAEVKRMNMPQFKPSAIRQRLRHRTLFKRDGSADKALLELEGEGYIRHGIAPKWNGTGRPPEALYEVHPDLLSTQPEVMDL